MTQPKREASSRGFISKALGNVNDFLFEDTHKPAQEDVPVTPTASAEEQRSRRPVQSTTVSHEASEVAEGKYGEVIRRAVEEATSDVYRKFQRQLEALKAIPDQSIRYQSALASSQAAFGLTSKDLLSSIEERERAFGGVLTEFEDELKKKSSHEVSELEHQENDLDQRIASLRAELSRLEEEKRNVSANRAEATNRFATSERLFKGTHEKVGTEIGAEHMNIKSHLQG